ncbi:MAG: hypothetical protein TREMPRED_003409 [Tremellales sp. Tagirdzhanova-0007]|nr:MAG: hypothetical protein TREMPRED_003409 [Tremellales sp. Tagirdzhanova-0007]
MRPRRALRERHSERAFTSFVDCVWTATENPSIEGIEDVTVVLSGTYAKDSETDVLSARVFSRSPNTIDRRANEKAFAAWTAALDLGEGLDSDLRVFYAGRGADKQE